MAITVNKALFKVVGNTTSPSSARGYNAVAGEALSFQLEDSTGVLNAVWETYDPASPSSPLATLNAPTFPFTGSALPAYTNGVSPFTAAAVAPTAAGIQPVSNSWFVRCTVSTAAGMQSFTRCINVTGGLGRKPIPGEVTENSLRGWGDDLATFMEAAGRVRYVPVNGTDIGMEIWLQSASSNVRVSQTWIASVATTDATVTTALTLPMPASKTFSLAVRWHGRSGSNELLREATFVYRRIASAGPTAWGTALDVFALTKDDATWGSPGVVVSGNNLLVQITGKAATTIAWDVEATWRDM